jgi:hypothetical protein
MILDASLKKTHNLYFHNTVIEPEKMMNNKLSFESPFPNYASRLDYMVRL